MLSYYLKLAFKSMRRNPVLTGLMIVALALGIGAFMTTFTVYHLMSGNPIPHKSDVLYAIQLDNWDPNNPPTESAADVQAQLTYLDAQYLMRGDAPADQQAAMYRITVVIQPEDEAEAPFRGMVRTTYGTFFEMFDVPFLYGRPWNRDADDADRRVVVLSKALNERLFGGQDSVGRTLRMGDNLFEIVGVLDEWQPTPIFYDPHTRFSDVEDLFMPMNTAVDLTLQPVGMVNCWKPIDGDGLEGFLRSECVWLQFWAEIHDAEQAREYQDYLNSYTLEQRELGRFPRPINNFMNPVMEWMDINNVVSTDNKVLVRLSALFLLVCILNTVGILLAKFTGKSSEIALRRAMGADKKAVFVQNLFEVSTIGLVGGIVGIGMAWLGLRLVESLYRGYQHLVHLDWAMLVTAIAVAVAASILAGLYPVWRTARLAPAGYLKTQ